MTRLTRVELRRLFSRRLVILALLAGVVVTAFFLLTAWTAAQPMTPAEQAQAQQWYDDARADWERNGERVVAECRQAEADQRAQGQDADFGCDQLAPRPERFFATVQPLAESLPTTLTLHAAVLLLLAFLVGATATAAELSTGAMSSWLTFEPRRLRVYASKVLAPGLGIAPAAVVLLLVLVGGAWLIAAGADAAGSMTTAAWRSTAWTMLRILALTVLAAAAGAALGFLLRHTAAVLGVAVGYLVVVEGVVASALPRSQPWLVRPNIEGWILGGTSYSIPDCTTGPQGRMCELVQHELSLGRSTGYLLVLVATVVVLAAVVFRRRDVV